MNFLWNYLVFREIQDCTSKEAITEKNTVNMRYFPFTSPWLSNTKAALFYPWIAKKYQIHNNRAYMGEGLWFCYSERRRRGKELKIVKNKEVDIVKTLYLIQTFFSRSAALRWDGSLQLERLPLAGTAAFGWDGCLWMGRLPLDGTAAFGWDGCL